LIPSAAGSNSLGVFTYVSPASGVGSGIFFIFAAGSFFQGGISGIIDPDKLMLKSLIHGVRITTLSASSGGTGGGSSLSFSFDATADGSLSADIVPATALSGVRVEGLAHADILTANPVTGAIDVPGGSLDLTVDGFKQSEDTTAIGNSISNLLTNGSTAGS
jgi:hypothetical protein